MKLVIEIDLEFQNETGGLWTPEYAAQIAMIAAKTIKCVEVQDLRAHDAHSTAGPELLKQELCASDVLKATGPIICRMQVVGEAFDQASILTPENTVSHAHLAVQVDP